MNIVAVAAGLASAFFWGAGDFAGGLAGRRASAVRVVLASQLLGTLPLIGLGLVLRQPWPPSSALWIGAVAGLAGSVGLLLLYLSLARGVMGVAAPLTAVAAGGIPLLVGLFTEGLPGGPQLAGFALAMAAIWVIAQPGGAGRLRPGDLWLPLLAGVGETAGNAFCSLSSQMGRLDVAAVLSALYPAATVALARVLLGERLTRRQNVGVGLALLAVLLIAV